MPTTSTIWTQDKILALAPDGSSAKSGRELATPRKWVRLGLSDHAIWGECQGSAKLPYQAQIDLSNETEPAFKCSCPSRKFPCKHALGLFLMTDSHAASFKKEDPPQWVSDWLASRQAKAEKKAQKPEQVAAAPIDPEAQAKRAAERLNKVTAGLAEIELWLRDLIRNGLAVAQQQPPGFWEAPAARMIDAQAPGVSRLLREMSGVGGWGKDWPGQLLSRLSSLHLLIEAFKRIDSLPPDLQAEIRSQIGWTLKEDEVLKGDPVRDRWMVLGQSIEDEDRLRVQRSWLWAQQHKQSALVLQFAHATQPLPPGPVPGTTVEAELVYYPGAYPQRAAVKSKNSIEWIAHWTGFPTISTGLEGYAQALARNPWIERFAMPLMSVVPVKDREGFSVRDTEGASLLIASRFQKKWELLALSGGAPIGLFAEWNGLDLLPMSVVAEGRFIGF